MRDILQAAIPAGANLALLFSLASDFPTEWSAFVNGAGDLSITIRRDYFPYFTTGRAVTIIAMRVYGAKPAISHGVGDAGQATTDLGANQQFTLAAPADPAGPAQVLDRRPGSAAFLIVSYTVG